MRHAAACVLFLVLLGTALSAYGIESRLTEGTPSSTLEVTGTFRGTSATASFLLLGIRNVSSGEVTVHWDECSLVLPSGRVERVNYEGAGGRLPASSEISTTIPAGASLEGAVWSAAMSSYTWLTGWVHTPVRIPAGGADVRLALRWSDAAGEHEGTWTWHVDRTFPWWLVVLGFTAAAVLAAALG